MNLTRIYSPAGVVCALRWNGPDRPPPPPEPLPPGWHVLGEHLIHARHSPDGWRVTTWPVMTGPLPRCARRLGPVAYDATNGRSPLGTFPSETAAVDAAGVMLAHEADPLKQCRWSDVRAVRKGVRNGLYGAGWDDVREVGT